MSACVYIPVQNSEEEVRVVLNQLPQEAGDILDILKAEQAPLDVWLIIAREYFKQGKINEFLLILKEGSSQDIDEYYADVRYERIAILNALGAYYTSLGKVTYLGKFDAKRPNDENFSLAFQYYSQASKIDLHEPSTWIGKGQLCVAKGDFGAASSHFTIALDEDQNNVAALLGQACVEFNMGENEDQYQKASEFFKRSLEYYKRALRVYPNCAGAVRLGIGYCRYRLGQFDKAQQAFQRVLDLDPENIEALVALGIMELQTNDVIGIQKGMAKMQRAFEIYPYCPMALNHLANHFFFTGQHSLVESLSNAAKFGSNHGLMSSHSNYNLARSFHSKGEFDNAAHYYRAAVEHVKRPQDFTLPFYGYGQALLKLGDLKNALLNFEKVLEVYPENSETLKAVGHIYDKLGQTEKAVEIFKKASRVDPKDAQAFMEVGELLMATDPGAALDALKSALNILKSGGEHAPVELQNNIGVLYFEKGEFELAERTFKEALGDDVCLSSLFERKKSFIVDCRAFNEQYKDMLLFHQLEEDGISVELPWDKVTTLFNYARLLEQQRDSEKASILYRLIIFKHPDYIDAYLRLAAMAKERKNIQLSIEMIQEALKIDDKCPNALSMLGDLELKCDDWVKAKDTFLAARNASEGEDSYSTLSLGNWNYFAAMRSEKRDPKLEATHLEKAKELYTKVLIQRPANLYAANGAGVILAEKGHFDVSKDVFTQVQEAASGNIFVQMTDVWINLAHVYFAQGHFSLAVKMYQNCLRKFYCNTDSQILLYLARTHYEAEQWQDCKKALLRAIHLAPSNYTLRFDAGVAMQKFSASTLQKSRRTADEVRSTVIDLKNAVRLFSQLSAASSYQTHGFDEKKIQTHVEYCKHLLDAAKIHCEAAEREEQQNRQRLEVARQVTLAEEAKRRAEEQKKYQMERRKQEDELKRVMQQEENFERIKEQWKSYSNTPSSKRRDRSNFDDEDGGSREKKKRKGGGKKRRKDKSKDRYGQEADVEDGHDEGDGRQINSHDEDDDRADDHLAAAGLEDSDVEEEMEDSVINRKRRAWSESDEEDDIPAERMQNPIPDGNRNSPGSDEEARGNNGNGSQDEDGDDY